MLFQTGPINELDNYIFFQHEIVALKVTTNMALRIRNDSWKEDENLEKTLHQYVKEGLRRHEILDFLSRDFPEYAWSFRTLDRRLQYFDSGYTDRNVTIDQIQTAVRKEMEGPGQLLGYRALHKKIRQVHDLKVPRDVVYAAMYDAYHDVLEQRAPQFKKKKPKGHFSSPGPNFVHSLDGHDKLMGYQNCTFPLAVYGCIDTCSQESAVGQGLDHQQWSKCYWQILSWIFIQDKNYCQQIKTWQRDRDWSNVYNACISSTESWWHGSNGNCHFWTVNCKSGKASPS